MLALRTDGRSAAPGSAAMICAEAAHRAVMHKVIVGPLHHLRLGRLLRQVAGTHSLQAASASVSELHDAKDARFSLSAGSYVARKTGLLNRVLI